MIELISSEKISAEADKIPPGYESKFVIMLEKAQVKWEVVYYIPSNAWLEVSWQEANNYCKSHPNDDQQLDLPLGVTAEEFWQFSTWIPPGSQYLHLQMTKTPGSSSFVTSDGSFQLSRDDSLENWAPSEPSQLPAKTSGCMVVESAQRKVCENLEAPFVCAKYYNTANEFVLELLG